jgi:hypothetical protein
LDDDIDMALERATEKLARAWGSAIPAAAGLGLVLAAATAAVISHVVGERPWQWPAMHGGLALWIQAATTTAVPPHAVLAVLLASVGVSMLLAPANAALVPSRLRNWMSKEALTVAGVDGSNAALAGQPAAVGLDIEWLTPVPESAPELAVVACEL